MEDKKITVKELANDLDINHTQLLRDLKHLNISAKTTTGLLTDEEVSIVRKHYKNDKNTSESTSVSGANGEVILRRKRVVSEKEEKKEKISKEAAKASSKDSSKDESKENQAVKEVKETKETKAAPKAKKDLEEVKDSPKKAKKDEETSAKPKNQAKDKAKEKPASAKIIMPAAKVVQTVAEVKEEAQAKVAAKVEEKEEKAQEIQTVISEEIKATETIVEEKVANKSEKAAKAENTEKVDASKESKNEKSEKSEKSEKAGKNAKEVKVEKEAQAKPAGATIISTPSNATMSAAPTGSSTKSILPPAGDRSFARDGEEQASTSTGVRILSKPTQGQIEENRRNAQNRSERPQNRDHRPGGGFNRENRDNRDRNSDNRGERKPGGQNPRFNNDNRGPRPQGQDKDTPRPQNQARPHNRPNTRPSAPSMDAIVFNPTEEQSRKKRNKNKKTYDSPTEFTPQQDFKNTKYSFDMDDDSPRRRRKPKKRDNKQIPVTTTAPMKAAKRKLRIEETIRVSDMAHQMGLKSSEIIKILFGLGVMATINSSLDFDTAQVVASEFEYEVEKVGFSVEEAILPAEVDSPEQLKARPPVITIMGHVDHGKTSLLDAIRETNVTDGEAGGITQHIGAYHVKTKRGEIVFLDTPGHEAFTAMRLRGAQVTDIVVLVVAADDGVMEQTREAINHAKAANVPIIVAVNKMDKEGANPDRVLRELAELGLQAEDWGGDTVTTYLSAKKREGIDELLELLVLQAELMELKANPDKLARGHIVEAKLDKGRGPVATVLIQEGTLSQGDAFVCGVFAGRVRALFNDQGKKIQSAGPSMPVEVQGFEGVPDAGEEFISLKDEKLARRIADTRGIKQREKVLAKESRVTLETFLSSSPNTEEAQVLNLVLKADVQGSLEAITEALKKLSTPKVRIDVIHGGAGSISETDIMLAAASNGIVIGFNVRPTAKVKEVADNEHVDIRFYDIIYKLVEEIQAAMAGLLAPVQKEVYLGQAEVRQIFTLSKVGTIAGSYVVDGKMTRSAGVRLLRDGVVIYTGKIASLKRVKDDAKEVAKGFECGISLENFNDIKVADIFEAFEMQEEAAKL